MSPGEFGLAEYFKRVTTLSHSSSIFGLARDKQSSLYWTINDEEKKVFVFFYQAAENGEDFNFPFLPPIMNIELIKVKIQY